MRTLARDLVTDGRVDEAFELLIEALSVLTVRNAELELLLKRARDAGRRASSERVSPEQLSLLTTLLAAATDENEEPRVEDEHCADAALEAEIEAAKQEPDEAADTSGEDAAPQPRRRRNRAIHMEGLPVVRTDVPVPEDKKDWERIGEDVTVRLRWSPAHFYREEIHTPVLRSPELDDNGDTEIVKLRDDVAPTLVPGSLAGPDVIAAVLVQKYERHLPLHRLHRAFLSDQGLDLPVSTLSDWAMAGGTACMQVADRLLQDVLNAFLVKTDATGIRVLDRTPERIHRGTLWCYLGRGIEPDKPPDIVFRYTPTGEGATGPWEVLAGRQGYVLADALNIYDRVFNGKVASATEVGCNSHALRKFKALLPEEPRAAYIVQLVRRAYRLETLADVRRLHGDARTRFRQKRTRPIFDKKLGPYLARLKEMENPTSPLATASTYYLNHWDALTRFLHDGRLPLDNNEVESALRPVRLGENNYLFVGSDAAGHRLAAILTLLATARAHGHNTHAYLTAVFTRLARPTSDADIEALLPRNWRE